jgi:glutaredoxin
MLIKATLAALFAALAVPAAAQYKVVAPDGTVSYTDRPPSDASNRVTPMTRGGRLNPSAAADSVASLPTGLREPAQKWPVTLYTAPDCSVCDVSRQWLQQRGIPFSEKRVTSDEDVLALERITGGRAVPAISIGSQPLRGFSDLEWASYLDTAGYPRESRLPRNWQPPPVTALADRSPATTAAAPQSAPRPAAPAAAAPAPSPSGIRF